MAPRSLQSSIANVRDWLSSPSDSRPYHAVPDHEHSGGHTPTSGTAMLSSDSDIESASVDGVMLEKAAAQSGCSFLTPFLSFASSRRPSPARIFWTLLPSFITRPLGRGAPDGSDAVADANTTSYLNGLRGIASLIVAIQHNTNEYFPANHRGWGDEEEDHYFIQLPFIRNVIHGSFAVTVFFVISGFALTYGPLKRIHSGRQDDAIAGLPSSVFRRPVRLFLPIVPVLLLSCFMVYLQIFYRLGAEDMLPSTGSLFGDLYAGWPELVNIMTAERGASTMPQAWTLTVEYAGSILVFLCVLAFARVASPLRLALVFAVFVWKWWLGRWQLALFLAGMMLAEVRHLRAKMPELTERAQRVVTVSAWILFVVAQFVGGYPIYGNGTKTLGYSWLNWVPHGRMELQRFWHSVAAIMLVTSLESLPALQRKLNARWVLYLGEISYGLYLVHWMVGMNVLTKGTIIRMRHAEHKDLVAWAAGFAITMPLCLWAADVHWRLVDQKSVKFAKWLSEKFGV